MPTPDLRTEQERAATAAFVAKESAAMADRWLHGDPDDPHPFDGLVKRELRDFDCIICEDSGWIEDSSRIVNPLQSPQQFEECPTCHNPHGLLSP